MSGRGRASAIALACAIQLACQPPTDPIPAVPKQLLVQGILDLGAQSQMVSVEWMDFSATGSNEVRGATVTITTPDGRVMRATEDVYVYFPGFRGTLDSALRNGMYRVDLQKNAVALVPGATYRLDVQAPDGRRASGTTTMPRAPAAPSDKDLTTFSRLRDTLRLSWPRVPGAKSYQVAVRISSPLTPALTVSLYTIFADTSVTIAGTARTLDDDPVFAPGGRADVVVTAVDDNYYTYFHPTVDPLAGAPPSRLTGALGVFGSITPVVVRRYDVR